MRRMLRYIAFLMTNHRCFFPRRLLLRHCRSNVYVVSQPYNERRIS
jgi:hypothetical protein